MKIDEKMLARLEVAHEEVGRVIEMIKAGQNQQVIEVDDKVIQDQIDLLSLLLEKKGGNSRKDKTLKRLVNLQQAAANIEYIEGLKDIEEEFAGKL